MIAILNMDKPKNCRECRLRSHDWGNEYVSSHHICHAQDICFNGRGFDGGRYIDIDKKIHPYCPLIEIVTCGECELMRRFYDDGREVMICLRTNLPTKPNRFCSEGERRERWEYIYRI